MADALGQFGNDDACILCRVAADEVPCALVARTPEVLAFISPLPLNSGHTLIIPHRHVTNLYDLPDELAGPILIMAARVARGVKRAFAADGITVRQHNEPAGGQEVFHFHLHVIPRFVGDDERMSRRPTQVRFREQRAVAERVRAALIEIEGQP